MVPMKQYENIVMAITTYILEYLSALNFVTVDMSSSVLRSRFKKLKSQKHIFGF
jgi:hypothetical protein